MDPISQAVLGGLAAQTVAKRGDLKKAAIMGALSGMAADLDVFIRSASDPLLSLEYHRHFTHSLAFIPFGGLICALVLHWLLARRWQLSFKQSLWWCTLGYATHALLDACTSYGTRLYWPFSDVRVAWDSISIIDPLFTLPLLALLVAAGVKKRRMVTGVAVAWMTLYLAVGFVQHERAVNAGKQLAQARGHSPESMGAKPSFGNVVVWKTLYEANGRFYIDAVKPKWGDDVIWEGDSIQKLDVARDIPWLQEGSQQANDLQRFTQFSSGYVALDPIVANRVIDIRYSMLPQQIVALWGIDLNPNGSMTEHVHTTSMRKGRGNAFGQLWQMLIQ